MEAPSEHTGSLDTGNMKAGARMHRETWERVQPSATDPTLGRREPDSELKVNPANHWIRLQARTRVPRVPDTAPLSNGMSTWKRRAW